MHSLLQLKKTGNGCNESVFAVGAYLDCDGADLSRRRECLGGDVLPNRPPILLPNYNLPSVRLHQNLHFGERKKVQLIDFESMLGRGHSGHPRSGDNSH